MGVLENVGVEYKVEVNNNFLKTVSAYANYNGGEIIFGISDYGEVIGVVDIDQTCLSIENKINDSIDPIPEYYIDIDQKQKIVRLVVKAGAHKPYYYKGKSYKRADTATVENDRIELNRLILEGSNQSFEEIPTSNKELTFEYLEKELIKHLGIESINNDILRTLDLYANRDQFNNVADLLSDNNSFPGIDIVRFGDSIDIILDREVFEKMSVLEQFEKTIEMFKKYYCYEEIVASERILKEKIPVKSFREALANAVVHRQWDVNALIKISMFMDRVEISSPGELPTGLTRDEYLHGQISLLRNPILGNVFFRLRYVERFGTGIRRILKSYEDAIIKPQFEIFMSSIKIVLPLYKEDEGMLSNDEKVVYQTLSSTKALSRKELEDQTGYNKDKIIRVINQLITKNAIDKLGDGRNTKYRRK